MNTKQAVAVIGASGELGSAIAKSISKGNYRVLLYSSNTGKLEILLNEIKNEYPVADAELTSDVLDACWEADIIVVAVPHIAEKQITESIKKVTNQKVLVSVSNPDNDASMGLSTSHAISSAEELQKLLPNAKVVKAFNTTFAASFSNPVINSQQVDCFIAGNDENALEVVYDLVKTAGFNPVIVGNLETSRILESMQSLLIQISIQKNYQWIAGWKILHN